MIEILLRTPSKAREILKHLRKFEGPLTADFQHHYSLRLAEVLTSRTTGEIFDLIVWLPEGTAFRAAQEADGDSDKMYQLYGWNRHLDAMINLVNIGMNQSWMFAAAHSKSKIDKPEMISGPREMNKKKPSGDVLSYAKRLLSMQG